jgi:hypothetical protein
MTDEAIRQWELMQRDSSNDIRQEDSLLVFIDPKHTIIDWYTVVKNIKKFGEPLGYTEQHYLNVMQRFVGYFAPALKPITDELNAIELAKFLMKMSMPVSKFERLTQQITNLTRIPSDNLRAVMAQMQGLALALYNNKPQDEQKSLVNRLLITALLSFTVGPTKASLSAEIYSLQLQGKTPEWLNLLDAVINSERIHGVPQMQLHFKTNFTPTPALFNTMHISVDNPANNPYSPVEYHIEPVNTIYSPYG